MCRKSTPVVYKAKGFYRGLGLYRQREYIPKVNYLESLISSGSKNKIVKRFTTYH